MGSLGADASDTQRREPVVENPHAWGPFDSPPSGCRYQVGDLGRRRGHGVHVVDNRVKRQLPRGHVTSDATARVGIEAVTRTVHDYETDLTAVSALDCKVLNNSLNQHRQRLLHQELALHPGLVDARCVSGATKILKDSNELQHKIPVLAAPPGAGWEQLSCLHLPSRRGVAVREVEGLGTGDPAAQLRDLGRGDGQPPNDCCSSGVLERGSTRVIEEQHSGTCLGVQCGRHGLAFCGSRLRPVARTHPLLGGHKGQFAI